MAITNYSELQAAVSNWMARGDVSGNAADFIMLAEAGLNRELPAVETDIPLTGTLGSRTIDISAASMVAPIALFIMPTVGPELELTPKTDGTFPYSQTTGQPRYWAIDGSNIDFDCPLDQAYSFRFRVQQRFALSDSAPTNWLLTNHADVYLAATLMWGGVFTQDSAFASGFSSILAAGIPSVKNIIAKTKRAELTVDDGLQALGRQGRGGYRI